MERRFQQVSWISPRENTISNPAWLKEPMRSTTATHRDKTRLVARLFQSYISPIDFIAG